MRMPLDRSVIACADALGTLATFDALIDVRSPAEFGADHIPGALSCPVLDDSQRALVGTLYRASPFEARRHAAALVARNIAQHLETTFASAARDWKPLVYCWRGGQRSAAMTAVLSRVGWNAQQLEGGYRAFRQQVVRELEEQPARLTWQVICGTTGSGKSRLLQALGHAGAQVLDLERLARHRGSVLGGLPSEPQPSQKAFDTTIWWALRHFDPAHPVFVESESSKVGNLRVPAALMTTMRAARCIRLELSLANRVALLREEYAHFEQAPQHLERQLDCLCALHGRERVAAWKALAARGRWDELVEALLVQHYDPAYLRSLPRNFNQAGKAPVVEPTGPDGGSFAQAASSLLAGV